jgi:hypothetical protein
LTTKHRDQFALFDVKFFFGHDFPLVQVAPAQRIAVRHLLERGPFECENFSHMSVALKFEAIASFRNLSYRGCGANSRAEWVPLNSCIFSMNIRSQ